MTTVGDAIKAAIDTNWNPATGGTEPVLYNTEDVGQGWPPGNDWVMLLGWTFRETEKQRNDAYQKVTQYIDMRVHSKNDANGEERLDELVTEIKRVVTATNVTGYHKVKVIDQDRRASDKRTNRYVADLTVELKILSTSSTATPGSTITSTAEFDELTVNTSIVGDPTAALGSVRLLNAAPAPGSATRIQIGADNPGLANDILHVQTNAGFVKIGPGNASYCHFNSDIAGGFWFQRSLTIRNPSGTDPKLSADDAAQKLDLTGSLAISGALAVTGVTTLSDESITSTQIADLLMFGSANSAYVPFIYELAAIASTSVLASGLRHAGATAQDDYWVYTLPLPTTKGGLKLYCKDAVLKINTADATDYVDILLIEAVTRASTAGIVNDDTNRTAAGDYTYTVANAVDCSSYDVVRARIKTIQATASQLIVSSLKIECYYAA